MGESKKHTSKLEDGKEQREEEQRFSYRGKIIKATREDGGNSLERGILPAIIGRMASPPLLVCDTAPVNTCASVCVLQCVCVQKYRPIPLPNDTHTQHCLVTYSRLPACQGGSQFCYRLSEVKEKTISRHILNLGEKKRGLLLYNVKIKILTCL